MGTALLIFAAEKLEQTDTEINSITRKDIGKKVKVTGRITQFSVDAGIARMKIQDKSGSINVILFKSKIKLTLGSVVVIEGKISSYRKELQINGETVNLVR